LAKYTLFVDESGEAGVKQVRLGAEKGASPYLTLGSVLLPNQHFKKIEDLLSEIANEFNKKDLHCNKLNHFQKVKYTRQVVDLKMKCFGLISYKNTLKDYKQVIKDDPKQYYNKCVGYLFECVGSFIQQENIDPAEVEIVMEDGNFDYEALKNFIYVCQRRPLNPRAKLLKFIDPNNVFSLPKNEQPLLQIADLVAHSLYKCVDKTEKSYFQTETRYLNELKSKFHFCSETNQICGYGVKPVHRLSALGLDPDVHQFLETLTAK